MTSAAVIRGGHASFPGAALAPAAPPGDNARRPRPGPRSCAMPACVLVADDEPAVLSLTARCLEHLGLRALCTASGEEAVELFVQHQGEVALVLLDLNMPGRGGCGA